MACAICYNIGKGFTGKRSYELFLGCFMDYLKELISSNAFNLIIGSLVTFVITFLLNKQNRHDDLFFKISEKKIEYYESLNKLINEMNIYLEFQNPKKLKRDCILSNSLLINQRRTYSFSKIFQNKETFIDFKSKIADYISPSKLYIHQELYYKLNFLDSYLGKIFTISNDYNEDQFHDLGFILGIEMEKMYIDIDIEIQKFFHGKYKNKKLIYIIDTYKYEADTYKTTILFNLFIKKGKEKQVDTMCDSCNIRNDCSFLSLINNVKKNN
jgi:hypothetical protein